MEPAFSKTEPQSGAEIEPAALSDGRAPAGGRGQLQGCLPQVLVMFDSDPEK